MSDLDFYPAIDEMRRVNAPSFRPTLRTWIKHLIWFLITFVTTTLTGAVSLFSLGNLLPNIPDPENLQQFLFILSSIRVFYLQAVWNLFVLIYQHPELLRDGLMYSVSLLFILTCHEFGHYIACRIYRVDATLPFFLPSPPMIGVGTFGAFIRILSPLPSRRAVFDIGVAGPLAGFIALVPIAILGVFYTKPFPDGAQAEFILNDPLLLRLIAWFMNVDLAHSVGGPFYIAAWIGLLVTSLNLIPAGQLDGGHAVYAVFGKVIHGIVAKIAFVVMAVLSILGFVLYNSPSGILFVIILAIMIRVGHPEPYDDTPLDKKRLLIAAFTLLVFILSFVPFPIQINLF